MKNFIYIIAILAGMSAFAQKEANNWYFGINAGVHFNDDGSVSALAGGQMQTNEGCSSISDSDGNLLFYTDGRTVWDRNHIIMPNADYYGGTGLLGDPSSTQSAIIVPKKNDPNIYYIFTVDEPHHLNASVYPAQYTGDYLEGSAGNQQVQTIPDADDGFNNGLNYSIIDLSLTGANGSIGNVTTRNVQLYTYNPAIVNEAKYKCSEKITALKNSNGTGFWVVTHFIDKFYAFAVDASGVNATPVVTQITPEVPTSGYRRNAIGCIKASPEGNYIAIAHQQMGIQTGTTAFNGAVYLYNFDKATGILSNPIAVVQDVQTYGVEFSPQEKKLYVSYEDPTSGDGKVTQYDLLSADISSSGITVATATSGTTLQLGPNGKIYKAINGGTAIDAINAPEEDGSACDYQTGAVSLPSGSKSVFGLPPFITSLFSAGIVTNLTCQGQPTAFSLHVSSAYDSVSWNFGDSSPLSSDDAPQHTYSAIGTYTVTADITHEGETETVTRDVTITAPPIANTPPTLIGCDTDSDGFITFTLTDDNAAILGSQPSTGYTVYYYATQEDADANQHALNAGAYTNTTNPQTVYVRVINNTNPSCYAITTAVLQVVSGAAFSDTIFSVCDDAIDGNDANGQATFDLNAIAAQMIPGTAFNIAWYATEAHAMAHVNPLPQNYHTGNTTIYAFVQSATVAACNAIAPIALTVSPLPPDVQNAFLVQCDPGIAPDGITQFNLHEADALFTDGDANYTVSYFTNAADAQDGINTLSNSYTNAAAFNDAVTAKVENVTTGCFRLLPLALQVTVNTINPVALELCDDTAEDGFTEFNLTAAGFENGTDTVAYYATEDDALLEQNAIPALYTNTVAYYQEVFARMENNNSCLAIGQINLYVRQLPNIVVNDTAVVCLNTKAYITLNAGVTGSQYSYLWSTGAVTRTIMVNQPGIYTVAVVDNSHATLCSKVRTITVTPSNVAQITDVLVEDLSDNNTVTIVAIPTGSVQTDYLYSIDAADGPWQESPYFEHVEKGLHTVYVYDANGCGVVSQRIGVLAIPNYFTPNGDSTNDYWRVPGISGANYTGSRVFIYDRYGMLITCLLPQDKGWDGTFNGSPLPATDYWYVVSLSDGRIIKGHFSLLR